MSDRRSQFKQESPKSSLRTCLFKPRLERGEGETIRRGGEGTEGPANTKSGHGPGQSGKSQEKQLRTVCFGGLPKVSQAPAG